MPRQEDVYKRIYRKTLEQKKNLTKYDSLKVVSFDPSMIETVKYPDFSRSVNVPAIGQSVVYLYDQLLSDVYLLNRTSIINFTFYPLIDFINRTKIIFLLFDASGLIDPNLINVYVTDSNTAVFIVNKLAPFGLSIAYIKGINLYGRYISNVNVPVADNLANSYLTWTNGVISWIPVAGTPGNYYIPVNAQGKVIILAVAEQLKTYRVTPSTNSSYNYINIPTEVGFVDLTNILHWKEGIAGFTYASEHTPLYDGFKVPDTLTRIVAYIKRLNFVNAYSDLRHQYNQYQPYMTQFLASTLPPDISSFTPYVPAVTEDTLISDFEDKMVIATKDFPNFYKSYLEEFGSINFSEYHIVNIRPLFTRSTTAIDFDKNIVAIDTPRYLNNSNNVLPERFFVNDNAVEFNDNTNGRVTTMSSNAIGQEFTIEGWFNPFAIGTNTAIANRIITVSRDNLQNLLFAIGIFSDGRFGITFNDGTTNQEFATAVGFIKLYNFYHFAISFKNNVFKLYINRELVNTLTSPLNISRGTPNIRLGCYLETETIPNRRTFNGLLSDIRIWTAERTIDDIVLNSVTQLSTPIMNLIAYWKCNEITGNSIIDYSGNNYNTLTEAVISPYYFNLFKSGIVIEKAIQNLVGDPLFVNPIVNAQSDPTGWTVPYQATVTTTLSVTGGVLYHRGVSTGTDSIRLQTPTVTLDKTLPYTIQFKIKYTKKVTQIGHNLYANGTIHGVPLSLETYLNTIFIDKNGFLNKEYRIPANTFTGAGSDCVFGLWSGTNQNEEIEYNIKEFSVYQSEYGSYFTPTTKAAELLKLPSLNIINPIVGSAEIWVTINSLGTSTENLRLMQINDNNVATRFLISLSMDGRLQYAVAGATPSTKGILSNASTIKPGLLYYVAMTWENNIMYAYLNGVLIGTATVGAAASTGTELYLGSQLGTSNFLNGIIHKVKFSKTRRSSAEIVNTYATKSNIPVDSNTLQRLSFDKTLNSPNELNHPITITTKHNLKNRLTFVDGLNVSPSKSIYDAVAKTYTNSFRENDITGTKIIEVDTGITSEPHFEKTIISSTNITIGPSTKINKDSEVLVYETPDDIKSIIYPQITPSLLIDYNGDVVFPNNSTQQVNKLDYKTLLDKGIQSTSYGGTIQAMVRGNDDHYYIAGTTNKIRKIDKTTLVTINESNAFGGPIILMIKDYLGKLLIITGDLTTTVKLVNPANNYAVEATSPVYTGGIFAIAIGSDGSVYIAGSVTTNKIWKLNKDTLILEAQSSNYGGNILSLIGSSDGFVYAGGSIYQKLRKMNALTLVTMVESFSYGNSITAIAEGIDGKIYIGGIGGKLIKLNPTTLNREIGALYGGDINIILVDSHGYIFVAGQTGIPVFKYEPTTLNVETNKKLILMASNMYTYTIIENIINFVFDSSKLGKTVHIVTQKYNKVVSDGYSYDGLIQKIPTWVSFVPKEHIHVFLNKRLLDRARYYIFNPFQYKILKGDTTIVTDLDTNTIDGEIFNSFITNDFEMAVYNITLTNGDKIVNLTDESFPFSKKYNLVFVDGKLIHPNDIIEIDNYRFSLNIKSINNMCILRRKFSFKDYTKFTSITDKWADYLATLTTIQIETLIGSLYIISNPENNNRSVFLTERHLFEVLYTYCMKDKPVLTIEDNYNISDELPDALLSDGRIPIATMRTGPYPRYQL
jgi:hypothetical protein